MSVVVVAQDEYLHKITWNADGLVPAIAQRASDGRVLMLAWMSRESLQKTLQLGRATYWSRSRGKLWTKGESSGNYQQLIDLRLDCDNDALLLLVDQVGDVACHTGRESCFFKKLERGCWQTVEPVHTQPAEMYGHE